MQVKYRLEDNQTAFKPNIIMMKHNFQARATSETGLLTTLHTLVDKYIGLPIRWELTAFSGKNVAELR